MNSFLRRIIFFLMCCQFVALSVNAVNWNCFITNYNNKDYGEGTTTWRIATFSRWTFFANQGGVLVHDGLSWQHFLLNNRSEARSVAVFQDKGRVYVGGENEFGYLEPTETGALRYHCLSDRLGKPFNSLGNVFDIYEADGIIYYRCDDYILIANNDKYRLIKAPHKIFSSVMSDMVLYVATDYGVYTLMGNKLIPIIDGAILKGKRINSMFKYGNGIMVATANDGLFFYDGRQVKPYRTNADELLCKGTICCSSVRENVLALGTIHYGLVLVDLKTGVVSTYGESNGLQSSTVLSVGFDAMGNIWAGLDCGIDYLNLNAPFSYLYKSPYSFGIGNAALLYGNNLYLATDRGLYCAPYPVEFSNGQAHILKMNVPSGSAWNLYRCDDEILCLHDKGIFSIRDNAVRRVTDVIGAWSCRQVKGHKDLFFVGVYNGLVLLRKTSQGWISLGRVAGVTSSGRYFTQPDASTLKIYNVRLGTAIVYKLDKSLLAAKPLNTIREKYPYNGKSLTEVYHNFENFGLGANILRLDASHLVLPCNTGFLMYNKEKSKLKDNFAFVQRIVSTNHADSVVYMANFMGGTREVKLPYAMNSVRIEFGVLNQVLMPIVRFRYRLNNGNWTDVKRGTPKEYSNLFEGKYRFEVEAVTATGKVSHDVVEFRILPPWYRSVWAYVFYVLLIILLVWWLWLTENKRIERKQLLAVREKDQEVKEMKIEIGKLEKEKLDMELRHKSQEIADLMISVKRKNEILIEIKQGLVVAMNQFKGNMLKEGRQQLVLINGKIDTNIEGDEILKRFEEQFDVVNNMFMQKLSAQFPSLSQNERMMCAYLRMNLSTKEMAPLLNISVRGVETMRYRLRKKLNLEREDNLMEFLNRV